MTILHANFINDEMLYIIKLVIFINIQFTMGSQIPCSIYVSIM